jgi:hypothetical protein
LTRYIFSVHEEYPQYRYFEQTQSGTRPFPSKACQNYTLYVLKELQIEYDKNPRLTNLYAWGNAPEYISNRGQRLALKAKEKSEIKRAYDFILDYVRNVHPGVSKIDVLALAHAEILAIPVVTDDY